jgi:hypothetical protein
VTDEIDAADDRKAAKEGMDPEPWVDMATSRFASNNILGTRRYAPRAQYEADQS